MMNLKLQIAFASLFMSVFAFSQVGINTTDPKATMDINVKRSNADGTGTITDNTQTFGLLAPRVTRAELTSNTASYGTNQAGALIYITDISGGDTLGTRVNVNTIGYYYYDSATSLWKSITSGASSGSLTGVNGLNNPTTSSVGIVDPIRFIYTPSISIDTSTNITGANLLIWELYNQQFSGTGTNALLKNATTENATIPVYPANYFDYYITAYDASVFSFPANPISDSGVLTYNVIGTASSCSYLNIVMVLRKSPR